MYAGVMKVEGSNNFEINESRFSNVIKKTHSKRQKESISCTEKFVRHLSGYSQLP
jgi:hypothetical protein